ncbi:hypothetical protein GCM10027072_48900 [Streptomyces bullii]
MDSPVAAADPVICRTSRFCTVSCIHVPALDTKFATDHQRMLRYLSDRQGERETVRAGGEAGSGAGEGRAGAGEADTVRYSKTSRTTQQGERRVREHRLRCAVAPVAGTGADHRGRTDRRVDDAAVRAGAPAPSKSRPFLGTCCPECG